MKSERRHELKTNSLARGLETLPDYWREYGSKLLLIILVGLIVFLLVRYWRDKQARDAREVADAMSNVRVALQQLDELPEQYMYAPPNLLAENRRNISQEAESAISTILESTKEPKFAANAWLARGDLNWKLATLPEIPGADTQPSLKIENRDSLLGQARAAYEKVLQPTYSNSTLDVFYARLGLAAIDEDQQQWARARDEYQALASSAAMPASFKQYAQSQLAQLPELEKPVILGPAAILPTGQPANTKPTTGASSTLPTSGPATTQASSIHPSNTPATSPAPSSAPTPAPNSQPATAPENH